MCNSNFHNKLIQITINCTLYITQIKPAHILYSYYSKFLDKVIPTIHLYSKSNITRKVYLYFYVCKKIYYITLLSPGSSYQRKKYIYKRCPPCVPVCFYIIIHYPARRGTVTLLHPNHNQIMICF